MNIKDPYDNKSAVCTCSACGQVKNVFYGHSFDDALCKECYHSGRRRYEPKTESSLPSNHEYDVYGHIRPIISTNSSFEDRWWLLIITVFKIINID